MRAVIAALPGCAPVAVLAQPVSVAVAPASVAVALAVAALLIATVWAGVLCLRVRRRGRELQQTDRRYRVFQEHAPVAIMVSDRDHRILDWNRAAERLFGWTRDEVLGRDFFEFMVPGEHVPGQRDLMDQTFLTARAATTMSANLGKDGRRLECDWNHSVITGPQGEVSAVVSMALDLTAARRTERELRASERRFRSLAENAVDVIATMDMDGRFTYVNPAIERMTGYTPQEFCSRGYEAVTVPKDHERVRETLSLWRETGRIPRRSSEVSQLRKDGGLNWVQVNMALLPDESGTSREILSITRDITEQRRRHEELQIRRAALDCCADAVVISHRDSTVEYVNPAFTRMTGFAAERVIGEPIHTTLADSVRGALMPQVQASLSRGESWQGEFTQVRLDGSSFPCAASISPVLDSDGRTVRVVAIIRDISERKALETRLERLANHDPLTGLPNRRLLFDRLGDRMRLARRSGQHLALLYIDLDGFKAVNDRLGHAAGDELLTEVARRFSAAVRGADTLARMSGDEFTALLGPLDDAVEADQVAGRLIDSLREPVLAHGEPVTLGVSIGVALFPGHAAEPDALLSCADQAMYCAKRGGRNRVAHYLAERDTVAAPAGLPAGG